MFIFVLIFLQSLWADDRRLSTVNLTGTSGPDSYQSGSLDALIALGDQWALTGSYFKSDSGVARFRDEPLVSTELRGGADWQINASYAVAAEMISRQDPYELRARGASLSARAIVSDLWGAARATTVSVKAETLKYTQDLTLRGQFASLEVDREVRQKAGTLTLDQEFTDWLSASLSYTRYNYSEESGKLAVSTARRRTSWGGGGQLYGQPDWAHTLAVTLNPWEWFEARLSSTRSRILNDDTDIKTNSLGVSFFWRDWQLDLDGSRTEFGATSGNDDSTQDYLSAGIGYAW